MKLLLDNNLSPKLARCLQVLFEEHQIVALRDQMPANTPDMVWIEQLHREGAWAVLTKDLRIRSRPHEKAAMDASKIVFFFLNNAWKGYDIAETAARLIRLIPKMSAQVELAERGRFELPVNAGSKLRPYRD